MNWMTSGRHRALRTTRGKKRRDFPAHVHQRAQARVRRHLLLQPSAPASDEEREQTAWYIRPILDANESHDIQMLELAREAATGVDKENVQTEETPPAPKIAIQQQEEEKLSGQRVKPAKERRCVFTPVKATRSRAKDGKPTNRRPKKKIASPPPRDMLFFNEGEQVAKATARVDGTTMTHGGTQMKNDENMSTPRWLHQMAGSPRSNSRKDAETQPFYASSPSSSGECEPMLVELHEQCDSRHAGPRCSEQRNGSLCGGDDRFWNKTINEPVAAPKNQETPIIVNSDVPFWMQRAKIARQTNEESQIDRPSFLSRSRLVSDGDKKSSICAAWSGVQDLDETGPRARFSPLAHLDTDLTAPISSGYHDQGVLSTQYSRPMERCSEGPRLTMFIMQDDEKDGNTVPRDTIERPSSNSSESDREQGQESPSSEASFTLPPPVDWHKKLVYSANEAARTTTLHDDPREQLVTGQSQAGSRLSSHTSTKEVSDEDEGDMPILRGSTLADSSEHTKPCWQSLPRTRRILDKIPCSVVCPSDALESDDGQLARLHHRLRQEQALTAYLHTLVRCHTIEATYQDAAPILTQ